jgi:dTDP-4-amino-4,6-dideoxygalactose transaminase
MIPFMDLKKQYDAIRGEIEPAVLKTLESTQFVLGREVEAFEKEFASFCGAAHAVALNSGTSALHLALLAADIGPGDEVITTPATFVATVAAIVYTGATPVFVDIDPASYTINPALIEEKISKKTRAILPVHLYGQTADMDLIKAIAANHGLLVIEDAAQAHGAEYSGRRAGGIGDIGCFSFYPGKNLGAYGEGGMLVTSNGEYERKARMLRDWGQEAKYQHVLKGYNYRMDGIQGAVLRVKLRHLESWTEARIAHGELYDRLLEGAPVTTPKRMPYARHVYHIYALRSPARGEIQKYLNEKGIQSGIHYPEPVHLLKAYEDLGYRKGDFPVAEKVFSEELSLPMFAELTDEQIEQVSSAIRDYVNG